MTKNGRSWNKMVVNRPSMIRAKGSEAKGPFHPLQSFRTVHFHKSSTENDRPLWTHSSTEISSKSGLRRTSTSSPYWIFKFLVSVHELKLGRPGCFKDENEGSKELGRRGRRVDVLRSPDQNQPFLIFEGVVIHYWPGNVDERVNINLEMTVQSL